MLIKRFDEKELAGITFVEGLATGTIFDAVIGKSQKKEEPMLILFNKVWDENENEIEIRDYILLTEKFRWKLAQIFKAIRAQEKLKEDFHSDHLPDMLKDNSFKCEIHLQEDQKDKTKKFMRIKRYIEPFGPEENNKDLFNEDVPY